MEIKCPNTIGGHQRDALAQMDCDDQVVPKKIQRPKNGLGIGLDPSLRESQTKEIKCRGNVRGMRQLGMRLHAPEATKSTQ